MGVGRHPGGSIGKWSSQLADAREAGIWTPAISFVTPGDLSVTYSFQAGSYQRVGNQVTVTFILATTAFTHGTASGFLGITGLPFTVAAGDGDYSSGSLSWAGITKTNYTHAACYITPEDSAIFVSLSGSGQPLDFADVADLPSGGTPRFHGQLTYFV